MKKAVESRDGKGSDQDTRPALPVASWLPRRVKITDLSLRGNTIRAQDAAPMIASIPKSQLTALDLGCNELRAAGAALLAEALLDPATQLCSLGLEQNDLREPGARELAPGLYSGTLTRLDLRSNDLGPAGAAAVSDALSFSSLKSRSLYIICQIDAGEMG